jgi:DNA primase small subunit
MSAFYRHLFPFRQLFLWLNAAPLPSRQWTHREFAFTLQNDAYLRYNSFATDADLKKEVLRLNPSRFEIGPVYSAKVRLSSWLLRMTRLTGITAQRPKESAKGCLPTDVARTRLRAYRHPVLPRDQSRMSIQDIDMTDYDSIRTCCSDKKICSRCWQFIAMAVKVLDRVFRGGCESGDAKARC